LRDRCRRLRVVNGREELTDTPVCIAQFLTAGKVCYYYRVAPQLTVVE